VRHWGEVKEGKVNLKVGIKPVELKNLGFVPKVV
jgi:hypothetical protein